MRVYIYSLLIVIVSVFMISCKNHNSKNPEVNKYNDTTYYIIPVATIIYPFDSIYGYQNDYERDQFLLVQINVDNKCIEGEEPPIDKYRKCPTLKKGSLYSDHVLTKDYISHIICFAQDDNDIHNCERIIKDLHFDLTYVSKNELRWISIYPLLCKREETVFKGYIIHESNRYKYATKDQLEIHGLLKKSYEVSFFLKKSQLSTDSSLIMQQNLVVLGLSRSFELNPDVIKVVDL